MHSLLILDNDLITLPNHFFSSGERLKYNPTGSGTTSSVGIATTTISGYGSTDKLPEYVYAIKVDDKSIRLAGSAEDALASNVGNYLDSNHSWYWHLSHVHLSGSKYQVYCCS